MALLVELAKGSVTTSDAAVITVPASQLWEVRSIAIFQPAAAVLKVWTVGLGTTATAVNVKLGRSLAAGFYSEVISFPCALDPTDTLNMVVSAGTTELTYLIEGYKTYFT